MYDILDQLSSHAMTLGFRLLASAFILFIGFKLVNILIKKIKNMSVFERLDASSSSFMFSFISIGLKIIVIVTIVNILGVPMSSVVALVASAGVAIGLAVQGALSNLVGGMMILLFKPFVVGDYIEAQGVSGTVKGISVFYTVLQTFDNKITTLPNGNLTNSIVTNFSSEELRRVDIDITADYNSDVSLVKKVLLREASLCESTLAEPAAVAVVTGYGEDGINYTLRVWCKTENYWTLKSDLLDRIRAAFKKENIEIPYHQMEVRILKDNGVE